MSPKVSQEHKEKRRNEIIEAARTIFIKKGFELTTMHDVVEQSGMSRGGVYQYFSNTEDMMRAILDKGENEFTGQKDRLYEKYTTSWAVLEAVADAHDHVTLDPIGLTIYEYFVAGLRGLNTGRVDYMKKRLETIKGFYMDVIEKGIADGEFNPVQKPEVIASFIMIMADGIVLHRNLDREMADVKGLVEELKIYLRATLNVK